MHKRNITYQDFEEPPNTYTETFYFNLTKPEVIELDAYKGGQLTEAIKALSTATTKIARVELVKYIILMSYGIKSADGKKFTKSDEIRKDFESSGAYPALYEQLASDDKAASDFIIGILPSDLTSGQDFEKAIEEAKAQVLNDNAELISAVEANKEVEKVKPFPSPPSPPKGGIEIRG